MDLRIYTGDIPPECSVIREGLREEALSFCEHPPFEPMAILIWEDKTVVAGSTALVKGDHLFVETLWVSPSKRGKDLGKNILKALEKLAQDKGLRRLQLSTYDFFNKDFYLKNGFRIIGTLDDWLFGQTCTFLRKELDV